MRTPFIISLLIFILISCTKNLTEEIIPIAPSDLTANAVSSSQVNLTWIDKSTNETGYKIQRKTGTATFIDIATVGKDVATFSDNGLNPGTTYVYRVYAYNSGGASLNYTNEATVTTWSLPQLTTAVVSGILNTSATSGGNISSDGGTNITARGIVWSTSTNPTIALSTKTVNGTGTGNFAAELTGLVENTTYYVRAYATNSVGTSYGHEVSFKTTNITLATGLLAYWPFNGNANDESGNGNHGSPNGPILTTDRFGVANRAYLFDGPLFSICTSNTLNNPQLFSYSLWVNTSSTAMGRIFGFGQNDKDCRHIFNHDRSMSMNSSGQLYFHLSSNNQNFFLNGKKKINDAAWHHIVLNYSNSRIEIYIDGVLDIETTTSTNAQPYDGLWRIGGLGNSQAPTIKGKIDDIRLYNRMLTKEEAVQLSKN